MNTNTPYTRRTLFGVSAFTATTLLLTACGTTDSTASSHGNTKAVDTGVRDDNGYHLNTVLNDKPTVTLFTDYQCPYCKKADPAYLEAAGKLDGILNVTVQNFPLPMHRFSISAARAMICAQNQKKYIPFSEKVFSEQKMWGESENEEAAYQKFADYAKELDLNIDQFKTDYSASKTEEIIKASFEQGKKIGVRGTPSFVLDGKVLENVNSSTDAADMVKEFKKAAGITE
ncbi:DsbA family protein [Rothia sp. CCM 9418]|uniref:DsbA family protein n=1 Tax=unclassified Rothia (in: high G+C Gram-positive bacteria) TaxID=2689056 RepID=UPI003AD4ECF5